MPGGKDDEVFGDVDALMLSCFLLLFEKEDDDDDDEGGNRSRDAAGG